MHTTNTSIPIPLILDSFKSTDVDALVEYLNDQEITRWTIRIPFPYTLQDGIKWINHVTSPLVAQTSSIFAIRNEQAKAVGTISIEPTAVDHVFMIGYWLAKDYRGRGFFHSLLQDAVLQAFSKHPHLIRMYASVDPCNIGSAKVLQKVGFRFEGRLRKDLASKNKTTGELVYLDSDIYALLREDLR